MSGRGTVNRVVQIGVETTPGTPVPANKSLPTMSIELTRELTTKQYRALGQKGVVATKITQDFCSGKVSGPLNWTELVYLIATLVNPIITTPPSGVLTRKWRFTAFQQGPDSNKTLTIQEGDTDAASQASNCLLTQFGIDVKEDDATIDGTFLGQNLITGSLTATPASIPLLPIGPREVDIYMDPVSPKNISALTNANPGSFTSTAHGFVVGQELSLAGFTGGLAVLNGTQKVTAAATNTFEIGVDTTSLGAYGGTGATANLIGVTKITDALTAKFGLSGKQGPKWVLNTSNPSYKETVELVPTMSGMVQTEHNPQSRALYDQITSSNNPYKLFRFKFTGPAIETVAGPITYNYLLTVDFVAQVMGTKQSDSQGVWAYDYEILPEFHAAFGNRIWEITFFTTLTAL